MSNQSFFGGTGVTNNQTDAIEASVNNAAASEAAALASKNTATDQATISTNKATESAASAAEALVSKNAASTSSSSALTSQNSATASASAASSSASSASSSAATATTKASQASSSASSSSSSASTATTKASEASASAASALTAKTAAETAKTAAETAETNAETAETNAAASASTATTKASEASTSAASALTNKNSTDTNAATATTKAGEAATSATAAASSATASAASATTSTASKNTAVAVTANYLGAHSSAPTQTGSGGALAVGMLYFDTTSDVLKVRASGGWINAGSSVNGTSARFEYVATANQTVFSGNDANGNSLLYDSGFCDVFLSGARLANADFTASNGTSITLAAGATVNDILSVVAYGTFQLNNGSFAGTTTVDNLTVSGTATAPTQAAGNDTTRLATTAFTQAAITALVGSVPATLNTLAELGDALGDDPNYATTTSNLIGTKMPKAGGAFTGDVTLGDNNKIIFGDNSDFKLYHSGSNSIIDNTSGGLFINQWVDDGDITFQNDDSTGGTTTYMLMQGSSGEVQLKHYGSTKISTKASGVEVAGNMVVSGTVDGVDIAARDAVLTTTTNTANAALPKAGGTITGDVTFNTQIGLGAAPHATAPLTITTTNQHIRLNNGSELGVVSLLSSGELELWGHGANESINFRTGSGTGTIAMNIVGTNVGIGLSNPVAKLAIKGANDTNFEIQPDVSSGVNRITNFNRVTSAYKTFRLDALEHQFYISGNPKVTINSSGNVGLGLSTDIDAKLHVAGSAFIGNASTNTTIDDLLTGGGLDVAVGSGSKLVQFWDDNSASTPRFSVLRNGNTGINTAAPSDKLHVKSGWVRVQAAEHTSSNHTAKYGVRWTQETDVEVARIEVERPAWGGAPSRMNFHTRNPTNVLNKNLAIDEYGRVTTQYQPSFRAGRNSNYTPSANSAIIFNSVDSSYQHFNIGGHYNISNGRFTCPVAGRYYFKTLVIYGPNLTDGQEMNDSFKIMKNGVNQTYSHRRAEYVNETTGNNGYYVDHASVIVNASANQYIEVVTARALQVHGNPLYTMFMGYLIG